MKCVLPFDYGIDGSTFKLTISEFDIKQVSFIPGATHIELTYGVLDMNFNTLDYDMHLANVLLLDKRFAGTSISLTPTGLPDGLGTILCVLGVRFYQMVDGELYALNAKEGVGIAVI